MTKLAAKLAKKASERMPDGLMDDIKMGLYAGGALGYGYLTLDTIRRWKKYQKERKRKNNAG